MTEQAYRDAAYVQDTDEALVWLVVIEHEALSDPIRLTSMAWDAPAVTTNVSDTYVLITGGDEYVCAAFEIIPPGESDEEPKGKLRVPNVDQRIGDAPDSILTPATVAITCVLESDPTKVVGQHTGLRLQNIQVDALMAEGDLLRPSLGTESYPKQWLRPGKFLSVALR